MKSPRPGKASAPVGTQRAVRTRLVRWERLLGLCVVVTLVVTAWIPLLSRDAVGQAAGNATSNATTSPHPGADKTGQALLLRHPSLSADGNFTATIVNTDAVPYRDVNATVVALAQPGQPALWTAVFNVPEIAPGASQPIQAHRDDVAGKAMPRTYKVLFKGKRVIDRQEGNGTRRPEGNGTEPAPAEGNGTTPEPQGNGTTKGLTPKSGTTTPQNSTHSAKSTPLVIRKEPGGVIRIAPAPKGQ